jgi:hypothetical protein
MGGLIFHQTNGKVVPTVTYSEVSMERDDGLLSKVFFVKMMCYFAPTIPSSIDCRLKVI